MARILVIDDEELARTSIAAILRRAGHLVTVAADGQEALEKFSPGRFEVLITDIVMPRVDGIEIVRTARRIEPGLRIIAMSGGGTHQAFYLQAAAALGADATLQKPFPAATLRQTIDILLTAPAASSEVVWYRHALRQTRAARERGAAAPCGAEWSVKEHRFRSREEPDRPRKQVGR